MTNRLPFAACLLAAVPAGAGIFEVETGTRVACTGSEVAFSLFLPQATVGLPPRSPAPLRAHQGPLAPGPQQSELEGRPAAPPPPSDDPLAGP